MSRLKQHLDAYRAAHGGKLPPIAGGATGTGTLSFLSNLPPDSYEMNPVLFQEATERQDMSQPVQSFAGLAQHNVLEILRVGALALVKVKFTLHFKTSSAGTVKTLPGFPYTLLREVTFRGNGETGIIRARGATLRARRLRVFRNPKESLEVSTVGTLSASTEYECDFILDVPIAHDMLSLIGVVLAQNPQTTLEIDLLWASTGEVFAFESGASVEKFEGKVSWEVSTFSVGTIGSGSQQKTILPDLTAYHGIIDNTKPIPGTGAFQAPLIRTSGQLLSYAFSIRNGEAAEIAPTALTSVSFEYGGNRTPRYYPEGAWALLDKNQEDYNGLVLVGKEGHELHFTYLDFEVDNPARDLWVPQALVELQSEVVIPSSVTVNSGAYFHYVQESLYPAT